MSELAATAPQCDPFQLERYTSLGFRAAVAGIEDPADRAAVLGGLQELHGISTGGISEAFAAGVRQISQRLGLAANDRSVGAVAFVSPTVWQSRQDEKTRATQPGLGETLAAFFGDPLTHVDEQGSLRQDATPDRREPRDMDPHEYRKLGLLLRLV